MTLAAVVDLEAPSTVRGRDTQREAQARLDTLARELATVTSAPVATVILFGEPATALQHFALENGYELIVAGNVAARSQVGSRRAGRTHKVPVLIGPASLLMNAAAAAGDHSRREARSRLICRRGSGHLLARQRRS